MESVFQIGNKKVGKSQPVFITAELGLNHNGEPALAREMIKLAAQSGVDAVKLQVFKADSFISGDLDKAKHQRESLDANETLFEMWRRLELSEKDLLELSEYSRQFDVGFYASAFDTQSIDLLDRIHVPAFKVASGEVTNLPLIRKMAEKGRPILMSVGMATLGEIEAAIAAIQQTGNLQVALLYCVANYPVSSEDLHLQRIKKLHQIFQLPVGYSDHTVSPWACIASVALGATFVEKHFTLDKYQPGSDHILSADPNELKMIVDAIRSIELSLGNGQWEPLPIEEEGRLLFRRSIVATTFIPKGRLITENMLTTKRPAKGIQPGMLNIVIGRTARRDIPSGAPITWEDV